VPTPIRALLAGAALAIALVGCSSAASDQSPTPPASTAASPSPSPSAASGEQSTIRPAVTVWFAGFKATVDEVTLDTTAGSPSAQVAMTFENTGEQAAAFDATVVLSSPGGSVEPASSDVPRVPAGTTGRGSYTFAPAEGFTLEEATLTFGRSGIQQASVPLGSSAEPVTLEPTAIDVDGTVTGGQLTLDLTGGELRADVPSTHRQVDAGRLALTLTYDATFTAAKPEYFGSYAFAAENLALRLPDGTTISPDKASIELLGQSGASRDLFVRFEVDDPAAGSYTLVVIDDTERGELGFTLD
jgi:hypothetical protein